MILVINSLNPSTLFLTDIFVTVIVEYLFNKMEINEPLKEKQFSTIIYDKVIFEVVYLELT